MSEDLEIFIDNIKESIFKISEIVQKAIGKIRYLSLMESILVRIVTRRQRQPVPPEFWRKFKNIDHDSIALYEVVSPNELEEMGYDCDELYDEYAARYVDYDMIVKKYERLVDRIDYCISSIQYLIDLISTLDIR